ncbi:MAG: hypothetical protein ACRDJH_02255 [Thermomicrobiales bacterium]
MNTRQCSTCTYFSPGSPGFLPGSEAFTGRCLHPSRQLPCEPQPWVRNRELPCRLKWDDDLWEPCGFEEDQLLDIRSLDPDEPGSGFNGSPRNILQRLLIMSDLPPAPAIRDEWIGAAIGTDLLHLLWLRRR